MSQEEVGKSIQALHAEIDQLSSTDVAVKEKLLALIHDVETQLENPQDQENRDKTAQYLPTLIEQFEIEHPKVTANLSRLLNTLSSIGI
ncbi:MAG: hypothetical protein DCF25_17275 [Leptolyngbya foveolarum]|uniref:DUF4404 domain-containing protein n=1 Tax=Leptolyngbya foveolarum TaxID=47253 RepID=A0A2W4U5Z8_9CYAN|nr:MAG: hypothetical protein DCF25_17275 [Leptolyngbya foveolarum]